MIAIDVLRDFFERTRSLYKSKQVVFNIDESCRWSYFFVDSDTDKLTKVGQHLEKIGYEIIGFLEPEPDDDDQETIYLRADRIETHSADSLHQRNIELYKISKDLGVRDYDGMDVGAIDGG